MGCRCGICIKTAPAAGGTFAGRRGARRAAGFSGKAAAGSRGRGGGRLRYRWERGCLLLSGRLLRMTYMRAYMVGVGQWGALPVPFHSPPRCVLALCQHGSRPPSTPSPTLQARVPCAGGRNAAAGAAAGVLQHARTGGGRGAIGVKRVRKGWREDGKHTGQRGREGRQDRRALGAVQSVRCLVWVCKMGSRELRSNPVMRHPPTAARPARPVHTLPRPGVRDRIQLRPPAPWRSQLHYALRVLAAPSPVDLLGTRRPSNPCLRTAHTQPATPEHTSTLPLPPHRPAPQVYVIKPGADQQSVSLVFPLRFSSRQERALGVACLQVGMLCCLWRCLV